jgi:hypothetical protein
MSATNTNPVGNPIISNVTNDTNPVGNPVITGLTNGSTVPSSVGVQQIRHDEDEEVELVADDLVQ